MLAKITPRYWSLIALIVWGAAIMLLGLLRFDSYAISEAAARSLLLVWSVVDRVINPVFVLGIPDLRALLLVPVGIYWPGSVVAAKVFTMLITFAAALFLHQWNRRQHSDESALLATGLLLIAPATINQINSIGSGTYILLLLAVSAWTDRIYRRSQRPLGGWFFVQILITLIAVTIHPMALALPLALAVGWHIQPLDQRQQRHVYIGIGLATVFALLLRSGWDEQAWLLNPVTALGTLLTASNQITDGVWLTGIVIAALTVGIIFWQRPRLADDLLWRSLVIAIAIGSFAADQNWSLLVLVVILYSGLSALIALNQRLGGQNFAAQRGLVMIAVFILTLIFMQSDKALHFRIANNILAADDSLIQTLALELADSKDDRILIMSQWPGRTMLATRRPVIPLPPKEYPDAQSLLQDIKGVTHILFNPRRPDNRNLAGNLAKLTQVSETIALQEGGVIVHLHPADKPQHDHPATTDRPPPS